MSNLTELPAATATPVIGIDSTLLTGTLKQATLGFINACFANNYLVIIAADNDTVPIIELLQAEDILSLVSAIVIPGPWLQLDILLADSIANKDLCTAKQVIYMGNE